MKNNIKDYFHKNNMFRITSVVMTILAIVLVVLAFMPVHFGGDGISQEVVIRNDEVATTGAKATLPDENALAVARFTKNSNSNINALVANYYESLIGNDEVQLSKYTDDIDNIDKLKRTINSQYVEAYQDIDCYVMSGLLENSYIVVAVSYIKYKTVDTLAANMDYFYVCTDLSNNIYISNKEPGEDVASYNKMMYASNTITDLASQIAGEYDSEVQSDSKLYQLLVNFQMLEH